MMVKRKDLDALVNPLKNGYGIGYNSSVSSNTPFEAAAGRGQIGDSRSFFRGKEDTRNTEMSSDKCIGEPGAAGLRTSP
jgi:hypothetical protein